MLADQTYSAHLLSTLRKRVVAIIVIVKHQVLLGVCNLHEDCCGFEPPDMYQQKTSTFRETSWPVTAIQQTHRFVRLPYIMNVQKV